MKAEMIISKETIMLRDVKELMNLTNKFYPRIHTVSLMKLLMKPKGN